MNKERNKEFLGKLEDCFRRAVMVPRIMHGKQQELETLISEEALLLAKYLRNGGRAGFQELFFPSVDVKEAFSQKSV